MVDVLTLPGVVHYQETGFVDQQRAQVARRALQGGGLEGVVAQLLDPLEQAWKELRLLAEGGPEDAVRVALADGRVVRQGRDQRRLADAAQAVDGADSQDAGRVRAGVEQGRADRLRSLGPGHEIGRQRRRLEGGEVVLGRRQVQGGEVAAGLAGPALDAGDQALERVGILWAGAEVHPGAAGEERRDALRVGAGEQHRDHPLAAHCALIQSDAHLLVLPRADAGWSNEHGHCLAARQRLLDRFHPRGARHQVPAVEERGEVGSAQQARNRLHGRLVCGVVGEEDVVCQPTMSHCLNLEIHILPV